MNPVESTRASRQLAAAKKKVRTLAPGKFIAKFTPYEFIVMRKAGIWVTGYDNDMLLKEAYFNKYIGNCTPKTYIFELGTLALD